MAECNMDGSASQILSTYRRFKFVRLAKTVLGRSAIIPFEDKYQQKYKMQLDKYILLYLLPGFPFFFILLTNLPNISD